MSRFLPIPVSFDAPKTKLRIYQSDRFIRDLDVAFTADDPDTVYYYPVDSESYTFASDGNPLFPALTDTIPPDTETDRPRFHFTARSGWLNDPNGCYFDGKYYHLFYQHNPVGPVWGNMHWGHAVSTDLLRWEHRPITLFPDEMGTMFSGSAIIDFANDSKLGNGLIPPILLYYTAAGNTSELSKDRHFTQCLAYSTDGGQTFEKYAMNPIIGWLEAENRDPKVWCVGDGSYVLALYLSGDRYALFTSQDLLHWTQTQTISLPGDDECPDLFPLGKKWVLLGASGWYLTGTLRSGVFTADSAPVRRFGFDHGNDAYAAQTFYTADCTRTRIAWLRWNHVGSHKKPFASSMTLPHTLSLKRFDGIDYLCSSPIMLPEPKKTGYDLPSAAPACTDFDILSDKGSLTVSFCGCTLSVCGSAIRWNDQALELPCPIRQFSVLIDRFSVEIFGAEGLLHLTRSIPLEQEPCFSIRTEDGMMVNHTTREW